MTDDETKAMRDALTFGTGYMLDGKHVPMEAVMTDGLVKRLRSKNCCDATKCNCDEAANRIEALEAALRNCCDKWEKENSIYEWMEAVDEARAALGGEERWTIL